MDFIAQANPYKKSIWSYIGGFLVSFVGGQTLGAIPLGIAIFLKINYFDNDTTQTDGENIYKLLDSNLFLFLMLLAFVTSMIVLLFWIKILHRQPIKSLITSRKKMDWGRFRFAFVTWGLVIVFITFLDYWESPEKYIFNFKLIPFLILLFVAVIFIPIQAAYEEFVFRGYLMQGIGLHAKNRWMPLVTTSLIFGLLHLGNPEISKLGYEVILVYIAMGFFFGIVTLMDEGIELSLGFHVVNNLVTALLVTTDWTAFQTESVFRDVSEPDVKFQFLSLLPLLVMLYIFTKKYNWTGWKEKLTGQIVLPTEEPSPINKEVLSENNNG
ncbi:MAG: CPBP family intramembrane metalloprotease domain-containing protein [Bacteroidetes bacterium HGW-Bacteroidetes-13]|nr:MAG: CPBP family intramembrane metalloprotease domain-containing protein [Bacteroidetes bacterium HGW-Bacteroidetes-13]